MSTAKMKLETKKWLWYALVLLVCYVTQTSPKLNTVLPAMPVLVVPVATAVAVFEGEIAGAAMGAVAGLLWDLSSARVAGAHGVMLCILCVCCTLACLHLLRPTWINISVLSVVCLGITDLADFIFTYYLFFENTGVVWAKQALPSCAATAVVAPAIVLVCRLIHDKYTTEE